MAKQTESTEKKEKARTLEEALLRLDEIIQKLEKKDTTLEDSFGISGRHRAYKVLQSAD